MFPMLRWSVMVRRYEGMGKKGRITIKVPRSQLETESVLDKVKKHLQENSAYAFTRMGLMVEVFGFKEEDLNGPFSDWPKGGPTLYTRVRLALEKLRDEGLVESSKQGKKFLYWWHLKE